jgi:hypothetical protein
MHVKASKVTQVPVQRIDFLGQSSAASAIRNGEKTRQDLAENSGPA